MWLLAALEVGGTGDIDLLSLQCGVQGFVENVLGDFTGGC